MTTAPIAPPVGIGSTIWVFNINRRRYAKAPPGRLWDSGGPIWREHWEPRTIVAETARSWILDREGGKKIPKKGAEPSYVAFSQAQIDEQEFVHNHGHRIADRVGRLKDGALLRRIADLLGHKP